jgi:hypothetical protein
LHQVWPSGDADEESRGFAPLSNQYRGGNEVFQREAHSLVLRCRAGRAAVDDASQHFCAQGCEDE